MMKLQYRLRDFCCAVMLIITGAVLALGVLLPHPETNLVYAEDATEDGESHFVTIYDDDQTLTVKTAASTVAEVLERAEITVAESDIVDPGLETKVSGNEFKVNIHRARPALVIDGANRRYVMTASFDPYQVARDAGLTIYDGDEVKIETNHNFLEAGAVSTFRIERNGGRMVTIEEAIPYEVQEQRDVSMAKGERVLEQAGEDGRRKTTYEVLFENNREVSRTLISEETILEPVAEIVRVGAKPSIPPERQQCAEWARQAGVAEADLETALNIIYRESGCRVDATNASSGAYGIPQALPGTKMASAGADWQTNPVTQIRWMIGYVNGRYGGWQGAMAHKNARGWY